MATRSTKPHPLAAKFAEVSLRNRAPYAYHDDERWFRVPHWVKGYHMVGRTAPGRRTVYSGQDVQQLCEGLEYEISTPGWLSLGVSQQLDIIATEILRRDRAATKAKSVEQGQGNGAHSDYNYYLSSYQWWDRAHREVLMENEALSALMEFSPRAQRMAWS